MSVDLTIKNGTIVTSSSMFQAGIAVDKGKIFALSSSPNLPDSARSIDASGLYVLPGVIDVHVHLREPGYSYKEDFGSGTAAAAAGGVTCVFDMPNNQPPIQSVDALREKIQAVQSKANVDFGLYGLLAAGNTADISPLAGNGVIGFKCFMCETLGNFEPPSDAEMLGQFIQVGKTGLRVSVHAENGSIINNNIREFRERGRTAARAHYESRPHVVEEEAVNRAIVFGREAECKLHIAHISSERGVTAVRQAKRGGDPLTAETCPHYLLLDDSDYQRLGPFMKVNPAIKTAEDKMALWEAINDGSIDIIASDHAPHSLDEKRKAVIFDCQSGVSGIETAVPLMLTQVNNGLLSLTRYVGLTSENPAKAWGIYPSKGCICVGSDADFTIVDMKRVGKIEPEKFLSKAKYSPFEGYEVKGTPVYTVVRGKIVMERGVVGNTPLGKMISHRGL